MQGLRMAELGSDCPCQCPSERWAGFRGLGFLGLGFLGFWGLGFLGLGFSV